MADFTKSGTQSTEHLAELNVKGIEAVNQNFGFRRASPTELETGLDLAEHLIGKKLADLDVVQRVHARTTVTAWVYGDPISGIHLMVPLTIAGEKAVRNGVFDPSNPRTDYCSAPGDLCAGVYVGAYAGASKDARKSIMQGAAFIRVTCFGTVPCFARAATDDGARSMKSLGFAPIDASDPASLWVQEAIQAAEDAA